MNNDVKAANENRDPLSGATGAHPVGTGVGAAVASTVLPSTNASSIKQTR